MKLRFVCAAAVCAAAVAALCACGGVGGEAGDVRGVAMEVIGGDESLAATCWDLRRSGAAPGEPEYMPPERLRELLFGPAEYAGELDGVDAWCAVFSRSVVAREVVVLHARSLSDLPAVTRALNLRANTLSAPRLFDPSAPFLGSAPSDVAVFTRGKYAILVAR